MFASGKTTVALDDIMSRVTEADILSFYLNISEVPCVIKSPLRKDERPSFGLYSRDGNRIFYTDLSTKDKGGLFDLLSKMWGTDYQGTLKRVYDDIPKFNMRTNINNYSPCRVTSHSMYSSNTDLKCRVREWRDYDIKYWESYGIPLKWLKYADVYPISHKIVIKDNNEYVFPADKYAYAYVEKKEGKITLKIYQPFNKEGYKWSNKHDSSVISLWEKVPNEANILCICSSLKDSLCLSANTNIPAIALQGEGYGMSDTAIESLKSRYKHIFILFDNDEAGLYDGKKLSEQTGFTNLILPKEYGEKDISDLYKSLQDKDKFKQIILKLFDYDD